jgi:tetratricopeptide (TPR) repeat protein
LLVVSVVSAAVACAENVLVRGELRDGAGPLDRYTVVLVNNQKSSDSERAFVSSAGSFQFHAVPQGNYMLEVRNMQGDVVKQQVMVVMGPTMETTISLGHPASSVPTGSGTVSLNQLRHDPDGKAAREFAQGEELLMRNDYTSARKHLMKALKADPDYADAHAELGTCAFRAGQLDEARQEFEKAVELDPKQYVAWGNLATLLFQSKAYKEAENAARKGLVAEPRDLKLHFVLGAARFGQGLITGDTTEHLELATASYPNAHLVLAESLIRLGDTRKARTHLEASLMSSNAEVRARAQYLIGNLDRPGR